MRFNCPEDIGELLWHFLDEASRELDREAVLPDLHSPALSIAAWAELFHRAVTYHWPGNVRELLNVSRQVLLASDGRLVLPEHLAGVLGGAAQPSQRIAAAPVRQMRDITAQEFGQALQCNRYAIAGTARQLRVSRQAVYRRIEASNTYLLASQIAPDDLRRALAQHGGDSVAAAGQLRVSVAGLRARLRGADIEWH